MSEQKHTPGPWEVEPSVDEFEGRTWYITGVSEHSGNRIRCNRVAADAALIAAAPDMRDAVHSLLAEIDARCEDMRDAGCYEGTLLTAIEEARAALAKAEGE